MIGKDVTNRNSRFKIKMSPSVSPGRLHEVALKPQQVWLIRSFTSRFVEGTGKRLETN